MDSRFSLWIDWRPVWPVVFLQSIGGKALQDAVIKALNSGGLGELEAIKTLPGMVGAAIGILEKVWQVPIDLKEYPEKPRLQALAALEREVIRRLPSSMRRPPELVDLGPILLSPK